MLKLKEPERWQAREREPKWGSGGFAPRGLCPQWGPGAKPLVGRGVRGLGFVPLPPKAGDILATEVTISCYSASNMSTYSVIGKTFKIFKLQCMRNDVAPLVELEVEALANLTSLSI